MAIASLTMFLLGAGLAVAETTPSEDGHQFDPDNAEDIMELCAGCHGEYGQGGGDGEYPRLAGLPVKYIADQLLAYRNGERESMAMAPYADERELPENDLMDISIYLASIELPSKMPDIDPDLDSYEKLLIASRVLNIPRLEGDTALGEEIYLRQCRKCHGAAGAGTRSTPPLAGQYSDYIRLQIDSFRKGQRVNKPMDKSLENLTDQDLQNLLAYLSIVDD
jgi:cytochrome c553